MFTWIIDIMEWDVTEIFWYIFDLTNFQVFYDIYHNLPEIYLWETLMVVGTIIVIKKISENFRIVKKTK